MQAIIAQQGDSIGSAIRYARCVRDDAKVRLLIQQHGKNTKALRAAILEVGLSTRAAMVVFKKFGASFPALEQMALRIEKEQKCKHTKR